jgi:hypothetical protein
MENRVEIKLDVNNIKSNDALLLIFKAIKFSYPQNLSIIINEKKTNRKWLVFNNYHTKRISLIKHNTKGFTKKTNIAIYYDNLETLGDFARKNNFKLEDDFKVVFHNTNKMMRSLRAVKLLKAREELKKIKNDENYRLKLFEIFRKLRNKEKRSWCRFYFIKNFNISDNLLQRSLFKIMRKEENQSC